ncbi:hypothetical protein BDV18DRAFT_164386 [Aspergillus unguis]
MSVSEASPCYSYSQCIAALQGRSVPDDLSSAAARCAVIRGLRCSYEFATSQAIQDRLPLFPEFVRARNARLIMSNVVPDGLGVSEAQPYCIWSPDFATEQTYRELARRYPAMRYQVGRACAAAGYFGLYQELDLLPDISIAEEAREGLTPGGDQIYQLIMSSPIKYAVMDDFTRSIRSDALHPAFLNGETHVRWKLEWRYTLAKDATEDFVPQELGVDIEEDRYMGLEAGEPDQSRYDELTPQEAVLLWEPLLLDLPTMKTGLLRQMAAYEGSVDRYARLVNRRTPWAGDIECLCVVRGIYHHTMFARWWQHQLDTNTIPITESDRRRIQQAINARRIMINDIGTFTEDTPCKPWLIWYPLKPDESALYQLSKRCPSMHLQIAIAAIYCDYQGLYERLNIRPSSGPMEAAEHVANPFYKNDLQKRAVKANILDIWEEHPRMGYDDEEFAAFAPDMEPTGCGIWTRLYSELMDPPDGGYYTRTLPFGGYVERFVFLSFKTIRKMEVAGYVGREGMGFFNDNDTRWFVEHEITKDADGNEVIEGDVE